MDTEPARMDHAKEPPTAAAKLLAVFAMQWALFRVAANPEAQDQVAANLDDLADRCLAKLVAEHGNLADWLDATPATGGSHDGQ